MKPIPPDQIARLYAEARQLRKAGDLDAAEDRLRRILAVRPNQPEALYQTGRIAMLRGNPKKAARQFEKAAEAKPGEAAIWAAWAGAVAALGDKAKTRAFVKAAKAAGLGADRMAQLQAILSGKGVAARSPLGSVPQGELKALLGLVNAGKLVDANTRAAALRKAHPDAAILADIHGNVLARLGHHDAARAAFEEALRLAPDFVEAQVSYGRFLWQRGKLAAGLAQLRKALAARPGFPPALHALGVALTEAGDTEEAIAVLTRAGEADPKSGATQAALGEAYLRAKDFAAAKLAFERATAFFDRRPATYEGLAKALDGTGRPEAALEAYDKAVAAAPDQAGMHGRRAILLQRMGRFEEADAGFRRAMEIDPDNGEPYRLMVAGHKLGADDPLIAGMEAMYARDDLTDHSRMNLGFALAKAMEDSGQHDRIFGYLHTANALMRGLYPFDIAERRAEIDRLKAAFNGVDYTRRLPGTSDAAPIFVTGMPRSGTTLVEQILASHSRVSGGGELGFAMPAAMRLLQDGAGGLRPLSVLADDEIADYGQRVAAHIRMRLPGSDRATDKSIQTYMVAGLVRLALPNAKIVVVHRDPRDTGLSIYKNVFAEGTHRYAYSLRDLGLYYRMYLEMIDFWRDRLPGALYEIAYEDLIAEPEAQSRALIAACGLDWEAACLDFHKTERRVSTLSLAQVRQPLYSSSMKAWQRHEAELADLIEALGDAIA